MGNYLVDEITGQVLYTLKPGDRIVTRDQAEGYKKKLSWTARPKGMMFTTADMAVIEVICNNGEFSAKELGYYMIMQTYIQPNKHGEMYRSNREKEPMTIPELCKELGIKKERTLATVIGKFMDYGLLTAFNIPTARIRG
ncbi:Hypothetical protein Tpal_234 [Trichococcus palustris]|uniref:Uncharacterized protein n=1 Tax=Trichococcus palustris TaxID=140314 RepID=A0A143Y7L4_9LACT|nr:hypothetical protein [Trichococcus palustris]CZQ81726.1 Hypothetical protein Tpal_234 [Trichococcus palustris]SFK61918.1 hypothetical protein SAMN04488076_10256 [Trichococcus palustris]